MLEPLIHFENACLENGAGFVPCAEDIDLWVKIALKTAPENNKAFEVSIRIVDEAEMLMLNSTYRQKNKTTNVLSFPSDIPEFVELDQTPLGDIAICAAVVNLEANEQNKTAEAHWAHMIIHGCLHLQGYDHIEEKQAEEMETLETQLLAKLNFQDPYKQL